jgi:histidinol-phosphate aminotransferase
MKFNETLENIKTYEPGLPIEEVVRQYGIDANDIIKLASNENPFGCSKKASQAVAQNAHMMFRYPDDTMGELKTKLANKYGVLSENLIIGSGSDQVIEFLIHAKAKHKILTSEVTFAMYAIYAATKGVEVIKTQGLRHDLKQMYTLYQKHNPEIIFICTPNNPTGDATKKEELYDFLEKIDADTLVVIDGAYGEYAAFKDAEYKIDAKELTQRFPNTIYLATFSKAYGLGGMRVGYGIASKEIIDALYKLRPPFNVTTLSLIAASSALEDEEFVDFCIEKNFEYMKAYENFAKKHNIEFIESYTNFITYKFDKIDSSEISHELLKKGIIVRNLKSYNLNAIRITIGTQEQNERFFAQLEQLLGS